MGSKVADAVKTHLITPDEKRWMTYLQLIKTMSAQATL